MFAINEKASGVYRSDERIAPSWADRGAREAAIAMAESAVLTTSASAPHAALTEDPPQGPVRALSEELEPPLGPVPVTAASFLFWVEPPAGIHHAEDCERVCAAVQSADERLDAAAAATSVGVRLWCFSRFRLREAFKLMGCKLQHAEELTERVFADVAMRQQEGGLAPAPARAVLSRRGFLSIVRASLLRQNYSNSETLLHFCIACDIKEQRRCVDDR